MMRQEDATSDCSWEEQTIAGHSPASHIQSSALRTIAETSEEEEDAMADEHDVNQPSNRSQRMTVDGWSTVRCDVAEQEAEKEEEEEITTTTTTCRGAPSSPPREDVAVKSSTSSPLVTSDDSDVASFLTKVSQSIVLVHMKIKRISRMSFV